MSKNLITLMTTAAELRSGGASWEIVGEYVRRSPKTWGKWPSRYKEQWDQLYLQEQRNRYAESGDEALMIMRRLLRSVSEKSQLKAGEIILKCGPHLALAKNANMSQTYEEWEWARHQQWEAEERKQIDAGRAKRGLPPATESEFLIELEDERRIRDGLPLVDDPRRTPTEEPPHPNPLPRSGGE